MYALICTLKVFRTYLPFWLTYLMYLRALFELATFFKIIRPELFYIIRFPKNFAKSTGKQLCWSFFFASACNAKQVCNWLCFSFPTSLPCFGTDWRKFFCKFCTNYDFVIINYYVVIILIILRIPSNLLFTLWITFQLPQWYNSCHH